MIPLPGSLVEYGEKILRFHKSSYFKTVEICIPMGRMLMVFIFLEPFWAITLGYLELLRGWNSLRASKLAWLRGKSTDKRWCIRADYGKIQFACLTCKHVL